jgi:hypothetical protein
MDKAQRRLKKRRRCENKRMSHCHVVALLRCCHRVGAFYSHPIFIAFFKNAQFPPKKWEEVTILRSDAENPPAPPSYSCMSSSKKAASAAISLFAGNASHHQTSREQTRAKIDQTHPLFIDFLCIVVAAINCIQAGQLL